MATSLWAWISVKWPRAGFFQQDSRNDRNVRNASSYWLTFWQLPEGWPTELSEGPIGAGVSDVSVVPAVFGISALHSLTSLHLSLSPQQRLQQDHGVQKLWRSWLVPQGWRWWPCGVTLVSSPPLSVSLVLGCHWCPETSERGGDWCFVPPPGYPQKSTTTPLWNSLLGFPNLTSQQ